MLIFASSLQKTISDKQNTTAEDSAAGLSESSKSCDEIAFNPNVFTDFTLGGNQEVGYVAYRLFVFRLSLKIYLTDWILFWVKQEIAADEENVKKVSSYLVDVVLPKFIEDLCTLEVSPMDGQTLTEALHAHGVNVRYIGRVSFFSCRYHFVSYLYV